MKNLITVGIFSFGVSLAFIIPKSGKIEDGGSVLSFEKGVFQATVALPNYSKLNPIIYHLEKVGFSMEIPAGKSRDAAAQALLEYYKAHGTPEEKKYTLEVIKHGILPEFPFIHLELSTKCPPQNFSYITKTPLEIIMAGKYFNCGTISKEKAAKVHVRVRLSWFEDRRFNSEHTLENDPFMIMDEAQDMYLGTLRTYFIGTELEQLNSQNAYENVITGTYSLYLHLITNTDFNNAKSDADIKRLNGQVDPTIKLLFAQ